MEPIQFPQVFLGNSDAIKAPMVRNKNFLKFASIRLCYNKIMKKTVAIVLLLFISITLCGCNNSSNTNTLKQIVKRDKIIIGIKFDSKPFGFVGKNGEIEGFDADVARQIARYILKDDTKVEFKPVTVQDRIMALNSKDVDMIIATMSINERRSRIVNFSVPYFVSGVGVMVAQNSTIQSIKDLNGQKTVIILGSTSEKTIHELAPAAIIQGVKTYTEGFRILKAGHAAALVADDSILYGLLIDNPGYKILPRRYTKEMYSIAFRQEEESQSLLETVNFILEDINSKGELLRIKQRWIPKAH